jgi:replicative DNA helicase
VSAVPVGVQQIGSKSDAEMRGLAAAPPNDMMAEQCVLGAMMLSQDAIADVIEALQASDFYRPAHEQIYSVIVDLYGRGEPVDAVVVSAELGKRGQLVRIGGAPYLQDLLRSVPLDANAGFYADIVREKAVLRRLQDATTRIAQWSAAGEGEVDAIVDRSQAEIMAVTERRSGTDYQPVSALLPGTLDEIEAMAGCRPDSSIWMRSFMVCSRDRCWWWGPGPVWASRRSVWIWLGQPPSATARRR